jgi:hypothetical protein
VFPTNSYHATNYSVDVLFVPGVASAPGAPTGVSASPATGAAQVSWTAPQSNGGSAITAYTVTVIPSGGSSYQVPEGAGTSAVVTGLSNGTSYAFTVSATNSVGTSGASSPSSAVTPQDTIFDFAAPQTLDTGDTSGVNLGVAFTPSGNGTVTGVRFYKTSANTGTHVGSLWSSGGALLAQATFTNESSSGWQTVLFSSAVAVTAGTTYVASYLAPNGHYSDTSGGLSSAVTNGPLTALASGSAPHGNGVYAYGSTSVFPTNSYGATNYSVDVLFSSS